jgi:hypothetical protein
MEEQRFIFRRGRGGELGAREVGDIDTDEVVVEGDERSVAPTKSEPTVSDPRFVPQEGSGRKSI